MSQAQPPGDIEVGELNGFRLITVPRPVSQGQRAISLAFLAIWGLLWAQGLVSVVNEITSGETELFLYIWLAAWLLGGVVAVGVTLRKLKYPPKERFLLTLPTLSYDSGKVARLVVASGEAGRAGRHDRPGALNRPGPLYRPGRRAPGTQKLEFSAADVASMKNGDQGLVIRNEAGNDVIMASALSVDERQWLLEELTKAYAGH